MGVQMVNDISALEDEGRHVYHRQAECRVCLMHKQGKPETMQNAP